jgi:hypothetical protein
MWRIEEIDRINRKATPSRLIPAMISDSPAFRTKYANNIKPTKAKMIPSGANRRLAVWFEVG